jgi:hypothetical protein
MMAQSMLMKKGLEGLFTPEKKFEAEAKYGQRILYVAWAVEILAALIGLTIAWATAYDAYRGIENPDQSQLMNALIGALPFLIIAVIEPTKIPLAGGFYKTRILGWKILILISLLALTAVTFETMFNGLERNLTNVTRNVVDSENRIQYLADQLTEKNRELNSLGEKSATELTQDLTETLEKLTAEYDSFVNNETNNLIEQIKPINDQKRDLELRLASMAGQDLAATKAQTDLIRSNIEDLQKRISSIEKTRDSELAAYRISLTSKSDAAEKQNKQKLDGLNSQKKQKQSQIDKLTQEKNSAFNELSQKIQKLDDDLEKALNQFTRQKSEALSKAGLFSDKKKIAEPYDTRINNAQSRHRSNSARENNAYEELVSSIDSRVKNLLDEISALDKNINSLIAGSNSAAISIDQTKVDTINATAQRQVIEIQKQISTAQNQIVQISDARSGAAKRDKQSMSASISQLDKQVRELSEASNKRISERKARFETYRQSISEQKNQRVSSSNEQKKKIPVLEAELVKIQNEIDENKKIKREASYNSQVYRLAALAYGKADVADVTRDEIKIVSVIWFGSIAFIVSTVGTVLALISYILRDPDAFVEGKRFSLTRRIRRLSYLVFVRMSRVLLSGINLLVALTRLILSFAEIFRGLIGKPVQRAIRRTLLAQRKRANRPRIQIVEKEVEKIVEKIVEVEVPVEKVVVTEVPVEIVRKELVYVPLYSTDSGLIDVSTELRGSKPKFTEANQESNNKASTPNKKAPNKSASTDSTNKN